MMKKSLANVSVIVGFVAVFNLIIASYSLLSTEDELFALENSTISVDQATALPLTTGEGNQVKVMINYSMGDESVIGQRINAVMGIYDRENGSLIKLTSFPDGFIINNTKGTTQLASTLPDSNIQNISAIVALTNLEKSEKYSNDVRTDLDLRTILPINLSPIPKVSGPT
jgi:hypothetical protein